VRVSDAIEIISRRCGVKRGRTAAIANRLQHAGLIALAEAKKTPPEIMPDEIAWLLLAVLAEDGVATAVERTRALPELHESLAAVFRGDVAPGSVIVREGGAIAAIGGAHIVYGEPAEDGKGRFLTTATFAAIVAEWNGVPPHLADAVRAISRI
jgi:hypothetical protein